MRRKGLLIDLEGIDGSGKDVQSRLLHERFSKSGNAPRVYNYPDLGGSIGAALNDFLHRKLEFDRRVQLLAFALDIFKDQEELRGRLDAGETVILDRYLPSTVAYQCGEEMPLAECMRLVDLLRPIKPDIIFLLDISAETSMRRKFSQKVADRHESDKKLLEKVRRAYRELRARNWLGRWVLINGEEDALRVSERIKGYIPSLRKK